MSDHELDDVLLRWRVPDPDAGGVAVVGPPGSGSSTLAARLRGLLPDTAIVDGPDPGAEVVVLVFDAAAPLGREDLALLESVRASGGELLFALTRIDAHRGWEAVLQRDVDLLAGHAPLVADVPVRPVSAATGAGLAELTDAIAAILACDDTGPRRRTRLDRVRLDRARAAALGTAADLRGDEDAARLRERRRALVAGRDDPRAEAASALRRLTALTRVDLAHRAGDRTRAAAATLRAEVDRADAATLPRFPQRLREEVAALTVALDAETADTLSGLATGVLGAASPAAGPTRPPPVVADPEPRYRGVEDRMVILVGASAGVGLGRLLASPLSGVAGLDLIALPLTLLFGGLAAWWLTRIRGLAAERAHLRSWLGDAMAQVRSVLEQRALARLVDAEAEIADEIGRAHRRRVAAVEPALADLDRAMRDGAVRTSGRLAAVERDLAVLERALAEPATDGTRPIR